MNKTHQTLSDVLGLLKNSTNLSSFKLDELHKTLHETLDNIDSLVEQMESYDNSLSSLVQILGDKPVENEDSAITRQRKDVQQNQHNVRAALVEAKLYQMQAKQLDSFTTSLLDKLQHQILTKRTLSPLVPAFWQGVYKEKSLSTSLLKDSGGVNMTLLLFGGATFTFLLILFLSHQMGKTFPKIFRAWAKANIEINLNSPPNLSIITRVFSPHSPDSKAKKLEILEQEEKILLREELDAVPLGTLGQLFIAVICVFVSLSVWNLWVICIHAENYGLAQVINSCIPACALILGAGLPLLGWTRGMPRPISSFLMAISLVLASNLVGLLEREIIAPNFAAFMQGAIALLDAFSLSLLFRTKKAPRDFDHTQPIDESDLTGRQKFEAILNRRWSILHFLSSLILILTIIAIITGYMALAFVINTQLLVFVYDLALVCLFVGTWRQLSALGLSKGQPLVKKLQLVGFSKNRVDQMKVIGGALGTVFMCAVAIAIFVNGVHFSLIDLYIRLQKIFLGALFADIPISPKMLLSCLLTLTCTYYGIQLACLWLTSRLFPTTQLSTGAQSSIITILTYTTWISSGIFCLRLLGVSVSSVTWVVSALSVGVGFGLQSIVKDFVSGIMLLAERPIQPGDTIEVSGNSGEVRRIAMRATNIMLPDGTTMIVPNSQFITSAVKNSTFNANPNRMVITFDFPTTANLLKINQIILKVAGLQKDILVSPAPVILTTALYGPDVNFMLRFWYPSSGSSAKIKSAFLQALFEELKAAGEHENVIIKG
ncbi:small-conductance mechanosensitive channel [Lasius niger]|uniref:Small-conductance mechanosensitive channel n=1 Tax=Lasius niger TaxID=67767 RepID=A0A0J7KIC0_LASNI|nr:small-conductance mechanosensitive channel [Lasius niger]